jgi:hypothetical protein
MPYYGQLGRRWVESESHGGADRMSLRRKIFLFCLGLLTVLAVVAANQPRGGAHVLQIKYLQPAWRTLPTDKPLRI